MANKKTKKVYEDVVVYIEHPSIFLKSTDEQEMEKISVKMLDLINDGAQVVEYGPLYIATSLQEVHYLMTDDEQVIFDKLQELKVPLPTEEDFRPNVALSLHVRQKMLELQVRYSLTVSDNLVICNCFFNKKIMPLIYTFSLKKCRKKVNR